MLQCLSQPGFSDSLRLWTHRLLLDLQEQPWEQEWRTRGCGREREKHPTRTQGCVWSWGLLSATEHSNILGTLYQASQNTCWRRQKRGRSFPPPFAFYGLKCHPINSLHISQFHPCRSPPPSCSCSAPHLTLNTCAGSERSIGASDGRCQTAPEWSRSELT